ncbi:hypothetical protein INT45_013173 [Circinella minor]|uniref:Transcription factor CBF/NF-Y/archaeal histone domain-containing protein n=1 Tax=Circinella minor TaxID=1195481 RepID=A0A8H7RV95_9FUNG|nr:hypothetical protein INT45_013173 [Circinella minor]
MSPGVNNTAIQHQHQQHRPNFNLAQFWHEEMATAQSSEPNFKTHPLPLARIKKVMKSDPEVKMISAEVPILFAKACETFITELTKRAWVHAEESKRRTLLRSDIAMGISKTDMCDFLIDIVPRMEATESSSKSVSHTTGEISDTFAVYQHPEQHQQQQQQHGYPTIIENNGNDTSSSSTSEPVKQPNTSDYMTDVSQISPEQFQHYQLQFQHFITHLTRTQQQQQQQQQQGGSPTKDDKNGHE